MKSQILSTKLACAATGKVLQHGQQMNYESLCNAFHIRLSIEVVGLLQIVEIRCNTKTYVRHVCGKMMFNEIKV